MVAVQQEIMYLCPNRGAGVFKVVSQKIIGGYVEGVGDGDNQLKAWIPSSQFYIADMLRVYRNRFPQFFL